MVLGKSLNLTIIFKSKNELVAFENCSIAPFRILLFESLNLAVILKCKLYIFFLLNW